MAWSVLSDEEIPAARGMTRERLPELLKRHPELVESFGPPDVVDDGGWWEFVIFDGTRWQTFHLDHGFRLSLQHRRAEDEEQDDEWLAELIISEFARAITQPNGN